MYSAFTVAEPGVVLVFVKVKSMQAGYAPAPLEASMEAARLDGVNLSQAVRSPVTTKYSCITHGLKYRTNWPCFCNVRLRCVNL